MPTYDAPPSKATSAKPGNAEIRCEIMIHMATEYARWLAKRDGIEIAGEPRINTDFVIVTRNGREAPEPRIRSVQFGEAVIDIPHWNFVPAEPVEIVE